jgi:hypothetical protein
MRPVIAVLAALLLAPCACARHQQAAPAGPLVAGPIDPGPAAQPAPQPVPAAAAADPEPTTEELAAFHAQVPK